MVFAIIGLGLIFLGFRYIKNPTMFRRGIWMKTSIAIRTLSEENYLRYMRGLGVAQIILGIGFIVMGLLR